MPQLTIDLTELGIGDFPAGAAFTLTPRAQGQLATDGKLLVATPLAGEIDANGTAVVDVEPSPIGGWTALAVYDPRQVTTFGEPVPIGAWTLEIGTADTTAYDALTDIPRDGPQYGPGIKRVDIDEAGDLIVTYTDGTTQDAGRARGISGLDGTPGTYYLRLYLVAAASPRPAAPTALVTGATGDITGADPWTQTPGVPGDNQALWVSETRITDTTGTEPEATTWVEPFEGGGDGPPGRGVMGLAINSGGDLIVTYTDGKTGNAGRARGIGVASATEPTAGTMRVTLTDGSHYDIALPAGVGIASVTEPTAGTMRVTLTDGSHDDFALPAGVGIASVTEPTAGTMRVTLTDGSHYDVTLPAGVGIKGITEDDAHRLTITLTDGSTLGPFQLPQGPPGTAGSLALTPQGNTISLTANTADTSLILTDLTDIIWIRAGKAGEGNAAMAVKADLATSRSLQIGNQANETLTYTSAGGRLSLETAASGVTVDVFNVQSGTAGPPGPGVPDGGSTGEVLGKKSNADQDTEWGVWSTDTDAPVSGTGVKSDPITIADGAIEAAKLKAGVIPDVSGIAANAQAITTETEARKTEDGKLAGRIDAADVKIAENAALNLPTFPNAGSRNNKVPKFDGDDLGWETDSGGTTFTPTQQNLYSSVKPMIEAITASSTINPIIGTDDDANSEIKLGVAREVIGEDWGNLVIGHRFGIGTIVPRSGGWYICKKPHTKGGTGPDNDPTNWQVLTNWRGNWDDDGWYDPGSMVLQADEVYVSLVAVTSSDPAPDHADNVKWKQISGGGDSGGTGAGHYTLLLDNKDVTSSATLVDLSSYAFAQNEVVEFVLSSTNSDSTRGVGFSMPGGTTTKWRTLSGAAFSFSNGETLASTDDVKSIVAVWTGDSAPTDADRPSVYALVTTKKASLHMIRAASPGASFKPSQANLFPFVDDMLKAGDGIALAPNVPAATITASLDLTQALAYPTTKATLKAGDNVHIVPNDTGNELVISSDEADPAAPRLYAIDSRDKRNVHPPYSYDFITEGFTLQAGVATREPGPVSRHGYDSSKPGDERDTTNAYNNANGVDFSNSTAGTTKRTKRISVEVTPDNQRSYSAAETLTLQVFADGYVKPQPAPEGQKIYEHVFHFAGGYQDPFNWDFDISYTQAPRSGEHDSWFVHWTWNVGSQQVVAGTIDAVKYTETLPALGSVPTQTFAASTAVPLNLLDGYTPPSLKKEVTADSVVVGLSASGTNYIGTNGPDESDKADVLNPTFSHSGTNYKPYMRAAQDLSQVKITATASARPATTGDVYLCTKAAGLPAQVIGNTRLAAGWTISYTGVALASQDYYLIVPGGGTAAQAGSPTAAWNANPGNNRINNVIDGIIHNAPLVEGINFSPGSASNVAIEDSQLVEAGRAGLLNKIRLISNGVVSEYSLRGVDRPLPLGSGQVTRCVGPLRVRGSQNGQADTLVYARMYWQTPGGQGPEVQIHFAPTNNPLAGSQSVYLSGVEVEYLVYQ